MKISATNHSINLGVRILAELVLMKGNEAVAEAAIRAGCRYFFGYPITPQNEIPEYMARRLPEVGGVYVQAESEVAAINMVYGAAGAGGRVLISSSSPGISLMQEGISYLCGSEIPCVIVNMMRGGPGLGGIQPSQSDYFQATKGGGHGDYKLIVYGPSSIQEMVNIMFRAFSVAEKYRNPVMILGDGMLGQMMEPVSFPEETPPPDPRSRPWATTGNRGGKSRLLSSIILDPEGLDAHNWRLQEKYRRVEKEEVMWDLENAEDAEWFLVAYGTMARVCRAAMTMARREGIKVGLIRPITLWPFPKQAFEAVLPRAKGFLCVEMSTGQMVEDVKLSVEGKAPVYFYGRTGGAVPVPKGVLKRIRDMVSGKTPSITDYYDRVAGGDVK